MDPNRNATSPSGSGSGLGFTLSAPSANSPSAPVPSAAFSLAGPQPHSKSTANSTGPTNTGTGGDGMVSSTLSSSNTAAGSTAISNAANPSWGQRDIVPYRLTPTFQHQRKLNDLVNAHIDQTIQRSPATGVVQTSFSTLTPAPPSQTPEPHQWAFRPALANTKGHFYLGPLEPTQVLALLSSAGLSKHAELALTGTVGGYLKYYHFRGHSQTPSSRRRAEKTPSAEEQEWWQCRLCHGDFHIRPNHVTNLGAHLYGTARSRGCLDLRADNPAEWIPPPARDPSGKIVRIRPDTPTPQHQPPALLAGHRTNLDSRSQSKPQRICPILRGVFPYPHQPARQRRRQRHHVRGG
ncbi:unnamed protein product [Tilletia controversa]|nr:unnamed protein product [Tilletia controversa]